MKPLIPLTTQLDFMMSELQGPERRAGRAFAQPFGTAADAATAWDQLYERSGGAGDDRARAYATDVFNAFRDDPTGGQSLPPNARFAMGYLTQKGMPLQNAAGIVGRLMTESYASMDPAARNTIGGGHGTYGVAQWRGPRLEALANFAGVPIEDIRNAPVSNGEGQYYPVKSEAPMAGLLNDAGAQPTPQMPQEQSPWKTGQAWNTIALALNSLRNQPDQQLAQALQGRLQQGRDRAQSSRTAAWLRSQGREDLAAAVESGTMTGKEAASVFYTPAKDTRTAQIQNYEHWLEQGKTPEEAAVLAKAGTTINVDTGAKADTKFAEQFAAGDAKTLSDTATAGMSAQRNLARLGTLEQLLANAPTGVEGAFKQLAGNFGINTEGLDNIQAATAIINSLVPEQRPAGSGPMSDADLELFKQSLPRIINQPGGNALIIDTLRRVNEYDAQGAVIVQELRAGKIDRATAFERLQAREHPLPDLTQPVAAPVISDEQRQADLDALEAALGGN